MRQLETGCPPKKRWCKPLGCPATLINLEVPVAVVPILRAGLALLEGAQTLLLASITILA